MAERGRQEGLQIRSERGVEKPAPLGEKPRLRRGATCKHELAHAGI